MGAFNISITGVGGHGCERKAKAGEKLHGRCGRFNCPDCMAYEFTQQLRQKGMVREGDQAYSVEVPESEAVEIDGMLRVGYFGPVDGKFWKRVDQQALFTHWPTRPEQVVDDMIKNERKSGQF